MKLPEDDLDHVLGYQKTHRDKWWRSRDIKVGPARLDELFQNGLLERKSELDQQNLLYEYLYRVRKRQALSAPPPSGGIRLLQLLRPFSGKSEPAPSIDRFTQLPARMTLVAAVERSLSRLHGKKPTAFVIFEFVSAENQARLMPAGRRPTWLPVISQLFRSWIPQAHLVGYLHDGQFGVLMEGLATLDIDHLVDQTIENLRATTATDVRLTYTQTLVGIGFSTKSKCRASDLIHLAEIALVRARTTNRGRYAIVDDPPVANAA